MPIRQVRDATILPLQGFKPGKRFQECGKHLPQKGAIARILKMVGDVEYPLQGEIGNEPSKSTMIARRKHLQQPIRPLTFGRRY